MSDRHTSRESNGRDGETVPPGAATRPCVIVTGASEGIGFELSRTFSARTRMPVVMIARRAALLETAAREVRDATGHETIALPLDVTANDAPEVIDTTLARHGLHVGILVNNAGIGLGGALTSQSEADVARLIDLNVRALTVLTRHVLPGLVARRFGGIINIGSLGGFAPGPYQAAYYASKAYVASFSRALASEMGGTSVHIAVVTPGPVETKFHARMGAEHSFYRYLVPAMTAKSVANATWRGWSLGMHVIQPGLFTPLLSLAMRIVPWTLLVPIVGWLLAKRYTGKTQ